MSNYIKITKLTLGRKAQSTVEMVLMLLMISVIVASVTKTVFPQIESTIEGQKLKWRNVIAHGGSSGTQGSTLRKSDFQFSEPKIVEEAGTGTEAEGGGGTAALTDAEKEEQKKKDDEKKSGSGGGGAGGKRKGSGAGGGTGTQGWKTDGQNTAETSTEDYGEEDYTEEEQQAEGIENRGIDSGRTDMGGNINRGNNRQAGAETQQAGQAKEDKPLTKDEEKNLKVKKALGIEDEQKVEESVVSKNSGLWKILIIIAVILLVIFIIFKARGSKD
jgi:hypothetical protein